MHHNTDRMRNQSLFFPRGKGFREIPARTPEIIDKGVDAM